MYVYNIKAFFSSRWKIRLPCEKKQHLSSSVIARVNLIMDRFLSFLLYVENATSAINLETSQGLFSYIIYYYLTRLTCTWLNTLHRTILVGVCRYIIHSNTCGQLRNVTTHDFGGYIDRYPTRCLS